jgi:hypothetical protein
MRRSRRFFGAARGGPRPVDLFFHGPPGRVGCASRSGGDLMAVAGGGDLMAAFGEFRLLAERQDELVHAWFV